MRRARLGSESRSDGRRPARVAELASFSLPSLEAIERRRLQLWILALVLLLAVATVLSLVAAGGRVLLPPLLPPELVQVSLIALVALFAAYAIEQEVRLCELTQRLIEERVLTASLTARLHEADALLEAGRALQSGLELDEILGALLVGSVELLDGRDGSIMLVHGEGQLRTVATSGASAARGACQDFGDGIAGRVAASREPVLIEGIVSGTGDRTGPDVPPRPTSAISVPLIDGDRLLGVLNVNARPDRRYSEHDLRALSRFAAQAAATLATAQRYEAQRVVVSQSAFQARHDWLTGLPNRAALLDRIGRAMTRAEESGSTVMLLFLDLDDFKRVNDSLGHAAGDRVLVEVARRLRGTVRAVDTVSRFGGDEYAILVEARDIEEGRATARRIQATLASPFHVEGRVLEFSASVGIAAAGPDARDADGLVRDAFTALHTAKRRSPGRIEIFDASMRDDAVRRLDLEDALRRALELGQLDLHFQPIVRLTDLAMVGLEALLRWRHPAGEVLDAAAFLPFAERSGLISAIDRWVLREVCGRLADRLRAESPSKVRVSVNLSPTSLQEPELVPSLEAALHDSGVDPARLVLEVTETAVLTDTPQVARRLSDLRSLGVRVALDDFGTGYSSLSWLRAFPVDQVKIDRTFVESLGHDAGAAAVVEAIVRLGRGLGFEVVAEGVSNAAQIPRLIELGCVLGQGFHLGRPLELAAVTPLFDSGGYPAVAVSG